MEIDIEYDAEGENSSSANNGTTNGEHNTEEENSFLQIKDSTYIRNWRIGQFTQAKQVRNLEHQST